jgi:hypothetical protein
VYKLIICCPNQLPFYLVFWAAEQRVQQELISTKISLVATLKYAGPFSCTHAMFFIGANMLLSCVASSFFNLGAFINEFVGTKAHKPVWMGA